MQGDLAEVLQTPEARVSLLVHELGERGLVRTLRAAPDRRVVKGYYTHVVIDMAIDSMKKPRQKPFVLMLGH